ncbi:MAG TPA: contractile injection system tape measure protein [Bacteroidia bacterium]|nr:contractile injection system tape measure protein [Bacteroidia bacterium]
MNNHVINRQIIELKLDSEKNAFLFQQRVRELYQVEILPMLDEMMSSLTSENEVLRIDRLELDLGILTLEKFDQEVMQVLRSHVEEQLKKEIRKASENKSGGTGISRRKKGLISDLSLGGNQKAVIDGTDFFNESKQVNAVLESNDQSTLELLRIFFADGLLPWWSADEFDPPDIDVSVRNLLENKPGGLLELFTEAIRHPSSALRVIQQIDNQTFSQLFSLLPDSSISEIKKNWSAITSLFRENDFLQLNKTDAAGIIFLTAIMIYNESGGTAASDEMIVEKLIMTTALVIRKNVLVIEKLLYNETLVHLLSDEKKVKVDTVLISYFSNWEKQENAAAVSVSGNKLLHVAALLNPIELRNIKQYELLEKGIKEFLQKNNERDIRQSRNLRSQEKVKPDLEKIISRQEEFAEKNNPASAATEEPATLQKTPSAGMTRYGGLALLSPFLPAFFREMKLLENDIFPGDAERYKAIHLLNFIATGKTKAAEYELLLHKLLCGLELTAPVPKTVKLSSAEKKEAMLFLDDIAEQWTALRTSSGEVLRNTFMRRNGIIEKKEDAWLLRVERGAVDIMLDTLPWTISIVRAPWMQQLLHIEW